MLYAIPDHPWVDSADGAAVRIAMSVGTAGVHPGILETVVAEQDTGGEGREVEIKRRIGKLFADLKVGADTASVKALVANQSIAIRGVCLVGTGFMITPQRAKILGLGKELGLENHIKPYFNGRDLTAVPRDTLVIDLQGLEVEQVRQDYPEVYQWVLERVKPERDHNREKYRRENWWVFGRKHTDLRASLTNLSHYIVTPMTAKHRVFLYLPGEALPDQGLISIALNDLFFLGVLSSRLHIFWALSQGGTLENRPRYNQTRCFETFPFPEAKEVQQNRIRNLAKQINAHRKRQQEQHPGLTFTGIYNVLEKLRKKEPLTEKDMTINERGLVSVLRQLHDELDNAVFDAYGWGDLGKQLVGRPGATTPWPDKPDELARAEEELLQRLVDLNTQRAAEEQVGLIRWLRPEYQNPEGTASTQVETNLDTRITSDAEKSKLAWPKHLSDQVQALRVALDSQQGSRTAQQIARTFKRAQTKRVSEILETLLAMGHARKDENHRYSAS